MPTILHIETATEVCSSALSLDGEILISRENRQGQSHATSLGVFVEEIMRFARQENIALDAVAVSSGPGSYTGLRIGVSQAKGLSYGLDIPLIAIPTHRIMAGMITQPLSPDTLLCPLLDARRMEVYATVFDPSLRIVRPTSADIVDENTYLPLLQKHKILFFGDGAPKCRQAINHPNASFLSGISPLASAMVVPAEIAFASADFVDAAYFEPFYLKEFVATIPKNKLF